eukprot:581074-Alexandrium_andersonii.AAC.1
MEQLQEHHSRHFQDCVFEGDGNAYEAAFEVEISSFAHRLREAREGQDAVGAWEAPSVPEFVAALK